MGSPTTGAPVILSNLILCSLAATTVEGHLIGPIGWVPTRSGCQADGSFVYPDLHWMLVSPSYLVQCRNFHDATGRIHI